MNPDQSSREKKYLRIIITVGLLLILLVILASYLYYGTQLARQKDNSADAEPTTSSEYEDFIKASENTEPADPAEMEKLIESTKDLPPADPAAMEVLLNSLETGGMVEASSTVEANN